MFVKNLVLLDCCDFSLVSLNGSLGVVRQSCDTLRFARMDDFVFTNRPGVKPTKDSSQIVETSRVDT
jgi:hypothetical protein